MVCFADRNDSRFQTTQDMEDIKIALEVKGRVFVNNISNMMS